jgi:hypothetical protein
MKYILEKCQGHVCVKDKNGVELSKWKNEAIDFFGGFDKVVARAKKLFPNLEVTITEEEKEPEPGN